MKKLVTFGEIMMRLSTSGFQRFSQSEMLETLYGGGEANVAIAVAQLGLASSHVTCFPDNDFGYGAAASLKKWGVGTEHIVYNGKRLGLYFVEKGSSVRASKVIYDRANSAFAELKPDFFDWEKILDGADWFHWTGITPAISQSAKDACLNAIKIARAAGITVSGDITFRKNLWQYGKTVQEVMPELVEGSDIVICGESEASEIFGITFKEGNNSYEDVGRALIMKFPNLKKVISTKRETISASYNKLSGVMWNGTQLIETKVYDIEPIIDRIGGGDAFMGGFISATLSDKNDKEALEFATAASVLKHTITGDALLVSKQEIEQLVSGEGIGRLVR